jgi:uncharacterized membrane protein
MRKIGWIALGVFYVIGGLNHFRDPSFYLPLIPDYLPAPETINILSGIAEIVLGSLIFITRTRRLAAVGIIVMLIAFIPSHVYFIQQGSCIDSLCVPEWVGWVRLVLVHPLLIYWAYIYAKK